MPLQNNILNLWQTYDLRRKNYIGLTFENTDLLPVIKSDRLDEDGNYSPDEETKIIKAYHNYIEYSISQVQKVLDMIDLDDSDICEIFVAEEVYDKDEYVDEENSQEHKHEFKESTFYPLLQDTHVIIQENHKNKIITGNCLVKDIPKIVEGIVNRDYPNIFPEIQDYYKNSIDGITLIYFPAKELALYVYDSRGGILVSNTENRLELFKIYKSITMSDKSLFNEYWFEAFTKSLFLLYGKLYDLEIDFLKTNGYLKPDFRYILDIQKIGDSRTYNLIYADAKNYKFRVDYILYPVSINPTIEQTPPPDYRELIKDFKEITCMEMEEFLMDREDHFQLVFCKKID